MCGRFTLTVDPSDLQEAFPEYIFPDQFSPRYNIAPGQPILVMPNNGTHRADFYSWGLIPSWAKDPAIGSRLINARAETLAEKPSFRSALKVHRCLIFANGFFEWQEQPGTKRKQPHFIQMKTGQPFCFAGLWDRWQGPGGAEVISTTIVTTQPNELVAPIHARMPVILSPNAYAQWLDPDLHIQPTLLNLLKPYPAVEMIAFAVSPLVNSPANDSPENIIPVS